MIGNQKSGQLSIKYTYMRFITVAAMLLFYLSHIQKGIIMLLSDKGFHFVNNRIRGLIFCFFFFLRIETMKKGFG